MDGFAQRTSCSWASSSSSCAIGPLTFIFQAPFTSLDMCTLSTIPHLWTMSTKMGAVATRDDRSAGRTHASDREPDAVVLREVTRMADGMSQVRAGPRTPKGARLRLRAVGKAYGMAGRFSAAALGRRDVFADGEHGPLWIGYHRDPGVRDIKRWHCHRRAQLPRAFGDGVGGVDR